MANQSEDAVSTPWSMPDELETELRNALVDGASDSNETRKRSEAVAGHIQELLVAETGGHGEIDTRSGGKIVPLDPEPGEISLEDIAHGLSNVGRFAGQSREMYSVARHSVHVSREVEAAAEENLTAQRFGLIHDGTEAYLSDVPGPVKTSLPGYKHAERGLDAVIVRALGLDVTKDDRDLVEEADHRVCEYELAEQFSGHDHDGAEPRHDPEGVPKEADPKELFLRRSRELGLR